MKRRYQSTLELIFKRPVSGNICWKEIEALLVELGATVEEREGSRIGVTLFGSVRVFHRPPPVTGDRQGCRSISPQVVGRKRSQAMNNIMIINGQKAVIAYDPEIEMFRGEFIGLSGGADFYAADVASLKAEGETSLRVYLAMCTEKGIEPYKSYSGKFNVRIDPATHSAAAVSAAAQGKSLNEWVAEAIEEYAEHAA
ncbi:type II toxin-antitoxin system HicB family antitoxin [Microvirgula aerodenitrificans]|uniref:type II toxin-antitoxin system HicB family antitoxin n=1 Tax=Microvirgula aerodenitrificans TaxID=57480 RepID=UPI001F1CEF69|nr:type II toxin-antitoxin system HicB family antitoxin [Microvirgula aerodenitrificans]